MPTAWPPDKKNNHVEAYQDLVQIIRYHLLYYFSNCAEPGYVGAAGHAGRAAATVRCSGAGR